MFHDWATNPQLHPAIPDCRRLLASISSEFQELHESPPVIQKCSEHFGVLVKAPSSSASVKFKWFVRKIRLGQSKEETGGPDGDRIG
jgi:hypothetical protein